MGVYPDSFPIDFETRLLPAEAEYVAHKGYRIIKYGLQSPNSYLGSWDEYELEGRDKSQLPASNEAGWYATSLFDSRDMAKHFLKMTMRKFPAAEIAVGTTDPSCGPSMLDPEKTAKTRSGNITYRHISWWIYKNASPWEFFVKEEIEDEHSPSTSVE